MFWQRNGLGDGRWWVGKGGAKICALPPTFRPGIVNRSPDTHGTLITEGGISGMGLISARLESDEWFTILDVWGGLE